MTRPVPIRHRAGTGRAEARPVTMMVTVELAAATLEAHRADLAALPSHPSFGLQRVALETSIRRAEAALGAAAPQDLVAVAVSEVAR